MLRALQCPRKDTWVVLAEVSVCLKDLHPGAAFAQGAGVALAPCQGMFCWSWHTQTANPLHTVRGPDGTLHGAINATYNLRQSSRTVLSYWEALEWRWFGDKHVS